MLLTIPTFSDERGSLSVIEKEIGFEIKRIFYIYNTPSESQRGGHAHFKTRLALICLNGSLEVSIHGLDSVITHKLEAPNQCLLLEPYQWHTMQHFSPNAVLLVLASTPYETSDYIFDLQEAHKIQRELISSQRSSQ